MITPQTNTTLEEIAERLLKCERICVCGHSNPDGDCLGSTLGLVWALSALGKDAVALTADDSRIDKSMDFLPGSSKAISADDYLNGDYSPIDAFVCVDVPSEARMGESATAIKNTASLTITIDHHPFPERMSELSYTDPEATSTTLLIWELTKHLGITIDSPKVSDLATCIYTGLLTDSGRFINQNTTVNSFEYAAELVKYGANPSQIANNIFQSRSIASLKLDCITIKNIEFVKSTNGEDCALSHIDYADMQKLSATDDDAENTITLLRSLDGVNVACMLKGRADCVRGSIRAKDDTDVAAFAREFGGGGHRAAAGFTLKCDMAEALSLVKTHLQNLS